MPTYVYKDEDGNVVERNVPISERDNQEGLKRILSFAGTVWSPTANGGMK